MSLPTEPLEEKTEKVLPVTVEQMNTPSPAESVMPDKRSQFALRWAEFRKRYLAPRRIVFWVVWIGIHTGLFVYGWLRQGRDLRLAATNRIGYSVSLSRGAGICIAFDSALILLPMLRTVITYIYPAFDFLALDENIWFHRQVAYAILFFTIIHVTGFYVNFFMIELLKIRPEDAYELLYRSWAGTTGWIMCLTMFLMYTTSVKEIRIMSFEVFRYTHFLYWVFFIALLMHAAGCFVRYVPLKNVNPSFADPANEGRVQCLGYNSWRILYGYYRAWRKTTVTTVIAHPERVMEIRFEKPSLSYRSGQWLWINVPKLSRMQWHPFTITSAPSDPFCSIHIRCVGDWTNDLSKLVGITDEVGGTATTSNIAFTVPTELFIRVDGPFGAPAQLVYRETAAIVVGSGIGITPWASVLKDVWSRVKNQASSRVHLKRLDVIWVCQNIQQLEWFANFLVQMQEEWHELDPKFFRVQLYLTRTDQMDHVPVTLRENTTLARPDWDTLIRGVRGQLEDETYVESVSLKRVGVYLCGGHTLGKELAKTCRFYTNGQYHFRFKKEHF